MDVHAAGGRHRFRAIITWARAQDSKPEVLSVRGNGKDAEQWLPRRATTSEFDCTPSMSAHSVRADTCARAPAHAHAHT